MHINLLQNYKLTSIIESPLVTEIFFVSPSRSESVRTNLSSYHWSLLNFKDIVMILFIN